MKEISNKFIESGASAAGRGDPSAIPRRVDGAWIESSDHPAARVLRLHGAGERWGITIRQAVFLVYYLTSACGNGAMAYRLAGYSAKGAKVSASRLLTNPNVLDAYREAAPHLTGGEGLLENTLLDQALRAVVKSEKRVCEKTCLTEDGGFVVTERITTEIEGGIDYKARVSAAEKLKALAEKGSSVGVGEGAGPVIVMQDLSGAVLEDGDGDYGGSHPPVT